MKIVISPAKSLNFEKELPTQKYSESAFLKESKKIHSVLKKKKPIELMELMSISNNLAQLNWQRNQEWQLPFTQENARPALYAFDGDVYTGLDAYSITADKFDQIQDRLRILSGLYGYLQPFDLIQPYRLEMGTNISIGQHKNLYSFWKSKLTSSLNKELKKEDFLLNLASQEYFSVLDLKKIIVPIITPEFKDYKDGKPKTISFFAKKARGLMVRFIIDNDVQTIDDLKKFNAEGYCFDYNLSTTSHLVFTR